MHVEPGSLLTLDVEKPAAGGRMLARHEGRVVLVWGAIPGERVRARVERAGKGVLFADTADVLEPSPDRRNPGPDWRCGGNVLAHVRYERQLRLKGEILQDALGRIGRVPLPSVPDVLGSPEQGYRMRARLHARGVRLGFFREGSHELCDAAGTGQLLPATCAWIAAAERAIADQRLTGLAGLEIAENIAGDERACHLELQGGIDAARFAALAADGQLRGLSAERADRAGVEQLSGQASVADVLHVRADDPTSALRLRRSVRAFFQGNRFLLERLVRLVIALVPAGPVVDLYAGVGLFGLSLAAAGANPVTLVEGDPIGCADLGDNAEPFHDRVRVERVSVETFLRGPARIADAAAIVDPPRAGLSKEAVQGIVRARPPRIVYVSCDVATLARDTRVLLDGGYSLEGLTGVDLFPNTAHVETVAAFSR
ncbi:MAG: class I SAM-dependent RNA methyltransferase [Acidobacteria bacterium]|nr:class I SAM-dependent RNA methyltransferase [Acidobacteriota bacterium]